jgi:hypothetical protein
LSVGPPRSHALEGLGLGVERTSHRRLNATLDFFGAVLLVSLGIHWGEDTIKRPDSKHPVKRTGDVRKDFNEAQLAWIGSVLICFNEVEFILDTAFAGVLGHLDLGHELTSRINGSEGKIEIISRMFQLLKAENQLVTSVAETLGENGFKGLKKYRDRIAHARIQDAKNAIGRSPAQRGKFEEILLTPIALEGLYKRLDFLRQEMLEILTLAITTEVFNALANEMKLSLTDLYKRAPQSELKIQESLARLQQHRKDRLSLPPLPEFPSESELSAADAQAKKEHQADIMKELGPLPDYLKNNPFPRLADRATEGMDNLSDD